MSNQPKQPKTSHAILRILINWAVQVVAFAIMAILLSGLQVNNLGMAVIAVLILALLNALLWPILSYILIPFSVLTLGLVAPLLNGLMIWLPAQIVPGFSVDGFWTAFWMAMRMTTVTLILSSFLTIDDDTSWHRNQIKRRIAIQEPTDVPGMFFLEIDGLARPILEKAMRDGNMPTLLEV